MKYKLITKDGFNKLISKLYFIKNNKIPEIIKLIKNARLYGDFKENYEYKLAKEQFYFYEKKIIDLENKISICKIFENKNSKIDIVIFGSIIEIINLNDNIIKKYRIVGEFESNIENNNISIESPLSLKILGKKKDYSFSLKTEISIIKYKIINIFN